MLHGSFSYVMQDDDGQTSDVHSVSAGLDYPGVGPEHSLLKDLKRVRYVAIDDNQALNAFKTLCTLEGIIPALESSHAVAFAMEEGKLIIWTGANRDHAAFQAIADQFEADLGVPVEIVEVEPLTDKFQQAAATGDGVDQTGQTSDANAGTIDWGDDQIADKAPDHEIFTHVWRTFIATGSTASIWLRRWPMALRRRWWAGRQPAGGCRRECGRMWWRRCRPACSRARPWCMKTSPATSAIKCACAAATPTWYRWHDRCSQIPSLSRRPARAAPTISASGWNRSKASRREPRARGTAERAREAHRLVIQAIRLLDRDLLGRVLAQLPCEYRDLIQEELQMRSERSAKDLKRTVIALARRMPLGSRVVQAALAVHRLLRVVPQEVLIRPWL